MNEIVMPRLSDSMTEGTVVRWLKQPGDAIHRGDPIVEIETDKATITYESDLDGVIEQILVGEGQTVPIGTTIATIAGAGGQAAAPAAEQQPAAQQTVQAQEAAPAAVAESQLAPVQQQAAPPPPLAVPGQAPGGDGDRTKASPIARRLARKLGIDLGTVAGSGPGGRIVKEDVEAAANAQAGGLAEPAPPPPPQPQYAEPEPPQQDFGTGDFEQVQQPPAEPPPPEPAAPPPPMPDPVAPMPVPTPPPAHLPPQPAAPLQPGMTGAFPAVQPGGPVPGQPPMPAAPGYPQPTAPMPGAPPAYPPGAPGAPGQTATRGQSTPVELTQAQQIVARRMAEAKATVPHYQVEVEADMTAALALREQLKYTLQPPPSVNDLVVKAAAMALRQYPRANASYRDGRFEFYSDVNIGVVVSAGDLLAVPTVFNADQKGLAQIAQETRALAAAVRDRTVQPAQLSGGTFSISNLGMFGVTRFNAIINTPQAAMLAVGAALRKPIVAEDGFSVQIRPVMSLTLSCDHRILYGHEAAEFLNALKSWLENPQALQI